MAIYRPGKRRYTALAAVLTAVCLLLCSCKMTVDTAKFSSKPYTPIQNPKLTVERFVQALHEGDFAACDGLMSNCASIGEKLEITSDTDAFAAFLYTELVKSYRLDFIDNSNVVSVSDAIVTQTDYTVKGQNATVTFRLTVLNFEPLCARMNEIANEIGYKLQFDKEQSIEGEEVINGILEQVLEIVIQEPVEQYYEQHEFVCNMVYTDGMWKLELSDELYNTLLGRA